MNELELAGVEKMKELGFDAATMADALEVYQAMTAADPLRIPRLDNTISYAARDNTGKWFELVAGEWVPYIGPGRIPKEDGAAKKVGK